ncbi:MAG: alpha,alpha-trehalase TreF [Chitinispirillaceae bacterium]|nr:alpha,alpha-trehalase TreF [Chitinispirillaceae bacterium]
MSTHRLTVPFITLLTAIICFHTPALCQPDPATVYGELFKAVQMKPVFRDSKKFPDCVPRIPPREIVKEYRQQKGKKEFDLAAFVAEHFDTVLTAKNDTVRMLRHIDMLWSYLQRPKDNAAGHSSLIPLPHPYIVPGGRFREIYYWDSYFTMLGLREAGRFKLMRHLLDNFCFLIDTVGHIPNGNRSYYTSRSQPPFFSLMVALVAKEKGATVLDHYLPWLEKEYRFWMKGRSALGDSLTDTLRVVRYHNTVLNRYYDARPEPRPESYKEDVRLAAPSRDKLRVYRDLRAAAESGWDFSSRWFSDHSSLDSIHTTDIIPVDLNCLLYHLESLMAKGYEQKKNSAQAKRFKTLAKRRKEALIGAAWNDSAGYFFDYDFKRGTQTGVWSVAGMYPLFFKMADSGRAELTIKALKLHLLKAGGVVTTTNTTGQQWDAPNGWAPLQWIAYEGLCNYGEKTAAQELARRWTGVCISIFFETGKMMEKYNVENLNVPGGGGEYDLQDGFGWTNGVFLAMWNRLGARHTKGNTHGK